MISPFRRFLPHSVGWWLEKKYFDILVFDVERIIN